MTDSIFKDPSSQAGIRALLKAEAQASSTEHQKLLEQKGSPEEDGSIENTTCEVTLEILDATTEAKLFEMTVDDGGAEGEDPTGSMLPNATERQRRFFAATFLSSAISNSALAAPGGKELRITIALTEYEDDGEGDERPQIIFSATTTFNKDGMPANVALEDQNGPVDISELPKIDFG